MKKTLLLLIAIVFLSCGKENPIICTDNPKLEIIQKRNFGMGFTTWSFGPELQDVNNTYQFIEENADVYNEHIDYKIPWNAWINNLPLPTEFTNEIAGRLARKMPEHKLLVSIGLLNTDRSELAEDFDGTIPSYTNLSDENIKIAYFKHVDYIVDKFQPDYLVIAIEINILKLRNEYKWVEYKKLIQEVKSKIKQKYPNIKISESITLHDLYRPEINNPNDYINEIVDYINQLDFIAISYYPFFNGLNKSSEFQKAFDFLHSKTLKPIAFVETNHLAENLEVKSFNLSIKSDECEQKEYLETLLLNAHNENYEFVIWWAHRDFDRLWETFPEEVKDLGKLWRDTGILDEDGNKRSAFYTWQDALNK